MSIRLGISPIGWSDDDLPELGGGIPLDTYLAEARELDFDGIELGHKFPRDPGILRRLLAYYGLRLISGWYGGRLVERSIAEELEAIEPHRALLAAMGCAVLVYAETSGGIASDLNRPLSSRPSLSAGGWREFGIRLTELADRLAERGVHLTYHHHIVTVVEAAAEIDRLMAATGNSVGLLLDTGLLAFAGADPTDVAWRHRLRSNHVRCTGTCSHRRPEFSRRRAQRCFHGARRRGDQFRASAHRTQGSGLPRLVRRRGRAGPGQGITPGVARRGFEYLSEAIRETGL
jgi:sugar phosphate isomerase/epimerase